jgi:hypothetical protein
LSGLIKNKEFKKGFTFFVEGKTVTPTLCLVRSGTVELRSSKMHTIEDILGFKLPLKKGTETSVLSRGGYFGNDTFDFDEDGTYGLSKYTVTALEDCVIGVLDKYSIVSVLGKRRGKDYVPFDQLEMHRILGAGTFGKVWLASRKGNKKQAYALKIQIKSQLIVSSQAEGVIQERDIMSRLDSDFIIKLMCSYQDPVKVYMLMKLYRGGELHNIMHTDTKDDLPEWAARFYSASVLEGLSYMHKRHIVYRDLKPENVLLDSQGYTVIIDLGFGEWFFLLWVLDPFLLCMWICIVYMARCTVVYCSIVMGFCFFVKRDLTCDWLRIHANHGYFLYLSRLFKSQPRSSRVRHTHFVEHRCILHPKSFFREATITAQTTGHGHACSTRCLSV